jgi:hypothetical protein
VYPSTDRGPIFAFDSDVSSPHSQHPEVLRYAILYYTAVESSGVAWRGVVWCGVVCCDVICGVCTSAGWCSIGEIYGKVNFKRIKLHGKGNEETVSTLNGCV